jgi:hypothetical protein
MLVTAEPQRRQNNLKKFLDFKVTVDSLPINRSLIVNKDQIVRLIADTSYEFTVKFPSSPMAIRSYILLDQENPDLWNLSDDIIVLPESQSTTYAQIIALEALKNDTALIISACVRW